MSSGRSSLVIMSGARWPASNRRTLGTTGAEKVRTRLLPPVPRPPASSTRPRRDRVAATAAAQIHLDTLENAVQYKLDSRSLQPWRRPSCCACDVSTGSTRD
jgi:hypothetical protein